MRRRRRKIIPARWSGWAPSRKNGRGGPKDSDAAKAYYETAAALGDEDAKKALEAHAMSLVIKDKTGKFVTSLCF